VLERTLFGEQDMVQTAVDRLRAFEPEEGYYLAFSGGKDSVVLKHLADMAQVKYDAHFQVSTVDPPEVLRFIRQVHPDVRFEKPRISMWRLIEAKMFPPTRAQRYCCREYRESFGKGRRVLTGVRWAESAARAKRQMTETCYRRGQALIHPIIDWTDDHVWRFIREREIPYCSLYDEGFRRVGCVMCPMTKAKLRLRQAARWPFFYRAYLRAFDWMLANRAAHGKETQWQSAQEVMDWWIADKAPVSDQQEAMF